MYKLTVPFLISLFVSCTQLWASSYAAYGFNSPNSFVNDNEFNRPYFNYKNAPRFDTFGSLGASSNRLKLEGPFDMTAYLIQSCPKKLPLEPRIVSDSVKCLEVELTDEILTQSLLMLASRQFQQFGAKACSIWPGVQNCLTEVIGYLESCQEKKYIGKVTDGILNYLCSTPKGAPEGTNNFGDFLMAGGLSCVDINGFAQCMKDAKDEQPKDVNFCSTLETLRTCGKPAFSSCLSPKPWEILTGGLDDLAFKFSCGALEDASVAGVILTPTNGTIVNDAKSE